METYIDGWYAKYEEIYRGRHISQPFRSPWEVFRHHKEAQKAVYLKQGREVLLVETRTRMRLPNI